MGRLHAPLPSGRCAVVSHFWVDSTLRSPSVAALSSPIFGSTPRSAPLRSLRCRLPFLGRLHAPLPFGRCAVVSHFWVDSTLRSPSVAALSSPIFGSTPRSAPLRSLRCRLPFLGRLHAPLPFGRCAVVSHFWVDSTLRSPSVAALSSPIFGSTPRSAPLRSLRCRLPFLGRLHAPLPFGRCAVVSHFWVDSTLRSPSVAALSSPIFGSTPRSAPLRSLRCRLPFLGRLHAPLPFGRCAVVSHFWVDSTLRSPSVAALSSPIFGSTPRSAPLRSLRCRLPFLGRLHAPLPFGRCAVVSHFWVDSTLRSPSVAALSSPIFGSTPRSAPLRSLRCRLPFLGRLHAPLPFGRCAVVSHFWVDSTLRSPSVAALSSPIFGSTPRSAPLRSLRCRLPFLGRLHAPLPFGRCAVVSHFWVDSTLRSPSVAALSSPIFGSTPRSAPLRSLRCRLPFLGRLHAPLPFG